MRNIASKTETTGSDVVTFFDSLRNLVNHCDYDVNSTADEEGDQFQPLLLRSVVCGVWFRSKITMLTSNLACVT